ncbi:Auxin transport protein BIG [Sesbania bispinosa]|nr:Auxin transport protein BIG [Sesbania bispinosa]
MDYHMLLLENVFRLVYTLVRPEKHDKTLGHLGISLKLCLQQNKLRLQLYPGIARNNQSQNLIVMVHAWNVVNFTGGGLITAMEEAAEAKAERPPWMPSTPQQVKKRKKAKKIAQYIPHIEQGAIYDTRII